MAEPKKQAQDEKTLDTGDDPVLLFSQNQTLINRMYGIRQSAKALAAQSEQIIEYLRTKRQLKKTDS